MSSDLEKKMQPCFNCFNDIYVDAKFCPVCGQANHPTKLSVKELVSDFFSNFFNWDSRFLATLRKIFKPSYLTHEYLAGKRKKYMNPIRFFSYLLIIQFAVVNYFFNAQIDLSEIDKGEEELAINAEHAIMYDNYKLYIDSLALTSEQKTITDSIEKILFDGVKGSDSTYMPMANGNFLSFSSSDYNITAKDALELSNEELFDKYEIDGFLPQLVTVQFIKVFKDRAGTIRLVIANCLWVIVLSIFLLAFVLKLLYIRHDIHLVEHIVLLCNSHSLFFSLGIVALLVAANIEDIESVPGNIVSIIAIILVFFIMKKHYKQGIFKTFIKYIFSIIIYTTIVVLYTVFIDINSFLNAFEIFHL